MKCSYKFRIYPNHNQEQLIQRTFGCVRYVYNYYLAQRKEVYEQTGKSLSRFQQDKDLTTLKKKLDWLREPDKFALQSALKDLDCAYNNFFRRVRSGGKPGYPKFKAKRTNRNSYRTNRVSVVGNYIKSPKLGLVKCVISKELNGHILSATVSQNPSGKYFVSLCCTDVEIEHLPITGSVCGIDLGFKDLAITSDGKKYPNNRYFNVSEKKLTKLQRRLSRKTKGSKRWEKQRIKVARMHEHIANQRRDNMQKVTTELIRNYDVVCIEDLSVSNMIKNPILSKFVSDASIFEFRRELEYKAEWYGRDVVVIDKYYPSSQLCSHCGYQWNGTKDLSVRKWICPVCGVIHDRDINAAINILNEGLRQLAA